TPSHLPRPRARRATGDQRSRRRRRALRRRQADRRAGHALPEGGMIGRGRHGWRDILRWCRPQIADQRGLVARAYGYRIVAVALGLAAPWPLKVVIDNALAGRRLPSVLRALGLGAAPPQTVVVTMASAIVAVGGVGAPVESRAGGRGGPVRGVRDTGGAGRVAA